MSPPDKLPGAHDRLTIDQEYIDTQLKRSRLASSIELPIDQWQAVLTKLAGTMRYNERLRSAISNLEPIKDEDWHGKWRIQSCLDALSNKDSDNAS